MSIQTAVEDYAKRRHLQPVSPRDFYRDLFPEGFLQKKGSFDKGKYNAVIRRPNNTSIYLHDGLEGFSELSLDEPAYISPVGYAGTCQTDELARELYAIVIYYNLPENADANSIAETFISHRFIKNTFATLDYQGNPILWNSLQSTNPVKPTYLAVSGSYLYLYYMFECPIPLYDNFKKSLESISTYLSKEVHTNLNIALCQEIVKPQQEDLLNKYPVIGTKVAGHICTAYKIGKKWSVYDLNALVPKSKMLHFLHEKAKRVPSWNCSKSIYRAFLKRVRNNEEIAKPGCLEALASYASKCNVDEAEYTDDQSDIFTILKKYYHPEELILHKNKANALFSNNKDLLKTWSLDYLEEITGIPIPRNKRNGRTQAAHLKRLHKSQSKEKEISTWRKNNPDGSMDECATELGISKKTVRKWWSTPSQAKTKIPKECECGSTFIEKETSHWLNKKNGNYYTRTIYYCHDCGLILYKTKARVDN